MFLTIWRNTTTAKTVIDIRWVHIFQAPRMHLYQSTHLLLNCPSNYEVGTTVVLPYDRDTKPQKSDLPSLQRIHLPPQIPFLISKLEVSNPSTTNHKNKLEQGLKYQTQNLTQE